MDFGAPVIGSLLVVTVAMLLTGGVKNVDDTSRTGVFWAAWLGVAPILPMLMLARAPGRSDRILWFVGGTGVATSAALVSIVLGLGVPLGDLPGTASLPIWGVAAVMIVLPCYMRGRRRSATRPS